MAIDEYEEDGLVPAELRKTDFQSASLLPLFKITDEHSFEACLEQMTGLSVKIFYKGETSQPLEEDEAVYWDFETDSMCVRFYMAQHSDVQWMATDDDVIRIAVNIIEEKLQARVNKMRAETMKRLFAATLHDMRNSLTGVIVPLEMLEIVKTENLKLRQTINAEIEFILMICAQGMNVALSESDFLKTELLCIGEIVKKLDAVADIFRGMDYNIMISSRLENYRSLMIDPTHLTRVVFNLLHNAQRAIECSAGTTKLITIDLGEEAGDKDNEEGYLVVDIKDFGPGFKAEDPNEMFANPNKEDAPHHHGKGFGIGLAYCKLICEKHGGSISAANNEESGATMTIKLPLDR